MIRTLKLIVFGGIALAVLALGSPLLFWLGRSAASGTEEDWGSDDPGVDVDGGAT